jgi:two-component system, response regulator RpfG
MPTENVFIALDLNKDILSDFMSSLYSAVESIEHDLAQLERDPSDSNLIDALLRSIHLIKSNCRLCYLDPLTDYTHQLEATVRAAQTKRVEFTALLREAFLMCVDELRISCDTLLQAGQFSDSRLRCIEQTLRCVPTSTPQEVTQLAMNIIKFVSGDMIDNIALINETAPSADTLKPAELLAMTFLDNDDLRYFKTLAQHINGITPYWHARSENELHTVLTMNSLLAQPVDEDQLAAAVFIHDLGMAFIPKAILNKNARLNAAELETLRVHPEMAFEWLKRMPHWQPAATMVVQHHERADGSGYPFGLKGDDICTGAQLIAVANTLFSITRERADRSYKRSLFRAVQEINRNIDTQFQPRIVDAFNAMMKQSQANLDGAKSSLDAVKRNPG